MTTPTPVELEELHATAWTTLSSAGDWFTGAERVAVARQVRLAHACELCARRAAALSPTAVEGFHAGTGDLSSLVVDTVHRIAGDAKRLTRTWADGVIARLGEGAYVELIGVVSAVTMLDTYRSCMGEELDRLPDPVPGEPHRSTPSDVGDVGAWVSQALEKRGANVSRALSLVPETERLFVSIESWQYSRDFNDLTWNDRALSRPQTELVAATVTSINECFY